MFGTLTYAGCEPDHQTLHPKASEQLCRLARQKQERFLGEALFLCLALLGQALWGAGEDAEGLKGGPVLPSAVKSIHCDHPETSILHFHDGPRSHSTTAQSLYIS